MDLSDADLALIHAARKRHRYGRLAEVSHAVIVVIYALGAAVLYRQWDGLRFEVSAPFEALRLQVRTGHLFGMILCSLGAVYTLSAWGFAASRRRSDDLILRLADQRSGFPDHTR